MAETEGYINRLDAIVQSEKLELDVDREMLLWKHIEPDSESLTIFANQRGRYGVIREMKMGSEDVKDIWIIEDSGLTSATRVFTPDISKEVGEEALRRLGQDAFATRVDIETLPSERSEEIFRKGAEDVIEIINKRLNAT